MTALGPYSNGAVLKRVGLELADFLGSGRRSTVDRVVADPIAQDNDKRNNIQIYTEIPMEVHRGRGQNFPILISCRYLVGLGPR